MEEDKKQFKPRLYSIAAGNPKTKSKDQLDNNRKKSKFSIIQEKNLLNYIMIILKLYLKLSKKQNKEQDLSYKLLNKCSKYYQ